MATATALSAVNSPASNSRMRGSSAAAGSSFHSTVWFARSATACRTSLLPASRGTDTHAVASRTKAKAVDRPLMTPPRFRDGEARAVAAVVLAVGAPLLAGADGHAAAGARPLSQGLPAGPLPPPLRARGPA